MRFVCYKKVEFSDTDMAGIVHFSRVFTFAEFAEHEFLRSNNLPIIGEWTEGRSGWPRLKASCDFISPLRFGDTMEIHLNVVKIRAASVTFEIFIYCQEEDKTLRLAAKCLMENGFAQFSREGDLTAALMPASFEEVFIKMI